MLSVLETGTKGTMVDLVIILVELRPGISSTKNTKLMILPIHIHVTDNDN